MKKFSITLGNFDGVHRGHQALIDAARALAPAVHVLTFRPHPAFVLNPERAPVRILDYKDQEGILLSNGVAEVAVISFSKELARQSGREFFSREILSRKPAAVLVGHDFRFGVGRECGVSELQHFCDESHIQFRALDPILEEGRVISSTWVRDCLKMGDFDMAKKLMGRFFEFTGRVIVGKRIGRTIGFPTANLSLAPERNAQLPLSHGVYAGLVHGLGPFVMNIGLAPTVNTGNSDQSLKVEIHLLHRNDDLYGQELRVQPRFYLRPEKKFSSLEELKRQIQNDVVEARRLIDGNLKDG